MGIAEARDRFFGQFPKARSIDAALRSPQNPNPMFFLSAQIPDPDLKGCGFVLLRLGEDIERRFGVNGEIAAYFTPWQDFQRRSFNAITLRTPALARSMQNDVLRKERFTPSRRVALLLSPDPKVRQKLDEWQSDSDSEMTLVAIDADEDASQSDLLGAVVRGLRDKLGERDLYRTQNPVSGEDFFGRSKLLRDLSAAIDGDQNVAILGLRRSGKTSVLRELGRQLLPRRVVMPIADFQMLDASSIDELAGSVASNLNEELKLAKTKGVDVWIGTEKEQASVGITLSALSDRIKRVAARNSDIRIAVAVDEVEGAASIARTNPAAVKALLGALRSAAQARPNVSLVFSGVANQMFRKSSLGDEGSVDNPMFGQVRSVYLKAFDRVETASLLRSLGSLMLLDWSDEAVDHVQRLTGGYPFFVRDIAAKVRGHVRSLAIDPQAADTIEVSEEHVFQVLAEWTPQAAEAWSGIVKALALHYPSAAVLLDPTLTEAELAEWVAGDADAQVAAEDLVALGLFENDEGTVRYSETLAALQGLLNPNSPSGHPTTGSLGAITDEITDLIRNGESQVLEFKETSRVNLHTGSKDVRMEDSVVKTVAGFLNADGGDLLIGISDSGEVKGLDPDLALFKDSVDRFERWLRSDLLAARIDMHLVADHVRTEFLKVRGKLVLRVSVTRSQDAAWVDDKTLYRRLGNQTVALEGGREVQKFLAQR